MSADDASGGMQDQDGPEPPEGVRLVAEDGTEVPCVLEQTASPVPGMAYWIARPAAPADPARTYRVRCDRLPPRTGFVVDIPDRPGLTGGLAPHPG